MRNLKIAIICIFLIVSVAFCAMFAYDRLMLDHEAPVIICDGEPLYVSVNATDRELCAGLIATDDVDGDITDRIIVRKVSQLVSSSSATVSYVVFDSSSNVCTYSRYVTYTDYRTPTFTQLKPLIYNVDSLASLEGYIVANDVIDGDITDRIRINSNNFTSAVEGNYPLHISVTNSLGDTSTIDTVVQIRNITPVHPMIELKEYLIYTKLGQELGVTELRSYIASVMDTHTGDKADPAEVEILSELDSSNRGSYQIYYSYTNSQNLSYTAILTVVVE